MGDGPDSGVAEDDFVDTHVHLDDPAFDPDRVQVLATARAAGVARFVNIGYCPARWATTVALARAEPGVAFTLGLHPGHAGEDGPETFATLVRLVDAERPVAIGEIGLDYSRPDPEPAGQRDLFRRQLDLAASARLPVVIHQRDAAADCATMLAETATTQAVVLHCYDGSNELLDIGLGRGWSFGIGGLVTRAKSTALRDALPRIPLDRIVLETDSPYLVTAGSKDRRNTPAAIPRIAAEIAALTGQPVDLVRTVTTATARGIFGPPVARGPGDD